MAHRMRTAFALVVAAVLSFAAARAEAKVRVAIVDFEMAGGDSPALALQLQDGFTLGLVRSGIEVIDAADLAKKLESHPDLQHCDSSPCLKSIGQLFDVKYILRVRVEVAGNSYKTVARAFSTEGTAPAALPIATKSKTCDVCTVVEARETMLRVADMLRPQLEEPPPPVPVLPPPPAPRPASLTGPIVAAMAGAVAVAVGFAVIGSNSNCTGTSCSDNRTRNVTGGVLIGAGAAAAIGGTYVTIVRARGGEPVTGVAVAFRW
jgi:hypothetical protein